MVEARKTMNEQCLKWPSTDPMTIKGYGSTHGHLSTIQHHTITTYTCPLRFASCRCARHTKLSFLTSILYTLIYFAHNFLIVTVTCNAPWHTPQTHALWSNWVRPVHKITQIPFVHQTGHTCKQVNIYCNSSLFAFRSDSSKMDIGRPFSPLTSHCRDEDQVVRRDTATTGIMLTSIKT